MAPAQPQLPAVAPGQNADTAIIIGTHPGMVNTTAVTSVVQVAVKNNTGVFYFAIQFPLYALFSEDGELNRDNYAQFWKSIAEEHSRDIGSLASPDLEQIIKKFRTYNLFHTARRSVAPQVPLFLQSSDKSGILVLLSKS